MNPDSISDDVRKALEEDVGRGDLTAQLLPENSSRNAHVICREAAVLCGAKWFEEVFRQIDNEVVIRWHFQDGDLLSIGDMVCELVGNVRAILTGERTALNFLQTLSGTATLAKQYADEVQGKLTKILDTRKTIPGLRLAQKYAVKCGGCDNHRLGLFDAILIKENHITAAGSIQQALKQAFAIAGPDILVEIEIESPEQLKEALENGARRILLDNFKIEDLVTTVQMNRRRALLEASGGITLDNVRAVANTGVDFISIGELTKHIQAIDFSMQIDPSQTV